jgi:hypothetical protein
MRKTSVQYSSLTPTYQPLQTLGRKSQPLKRNTKPHRRRNSPSLSPNRRPIFLEFVRQEGLHKKVKDIEALKTCIGMSAVLRCMTRMGKKNGFNFIAPEKVLLGDPSKDFSVRMGQVYDMISDAIRARYH